MLPGDHGGCGAFKNYHRVSRGVGEGGTGATQMDFSSDAAADDDSTELLLILRFTSGGIVFPLPAPQEQTPLTRD